jgi:hypothetical protein
MKAHISLRIATFAMFALFGLSANAQAQNNDPMSALRNTRPIDAAALGELAGGSGIGGSPEAVINSVVGGNTIGNVGSTGTIANTNLTGNSGVTTMIANSGNQVSIAETTVVNVYMH